MAEERLLRENQELHQQLRAAWVGQQTLKQVIVMAVPTGFHSAIAWANSKNFAHNV